MPKAVKPLVPMLASPAGDLPSLEGWLVEPKWDGIRVIASISEDVVRLWSRNGIDKAPQFPEVSAALLVLARQKGPMVLDGEVIAIDAKGKPLRFQALQARAKTAARTAFIAFDCLAAGQESLMANPLTVRRAVLEKLVRKSGVAVIRRGDACPCGSAGATRLLAAAQREGWEGLILKQRDSRYTPGSRSPLWRKVKLEHEQEFVIGGYALPESAGRSHFAALLVGYYDEEGRLQYAGKVGTGYSQATLEKLGGMLAKLKQSTPPFANAPRAHAGNAWVRPVLVAQVRYNEMTDAGVLRQPAFLGLRDDKDARDVRLETATSRGAILETLRCGK